MTSSELHALLMSKRDGTKLSIKERIQYFGMYSLTQLANAVGSIWLLLAIIGGSRRRSLALLVAYDQLANAAFGGSEDETISSRAAKVRDKGGKWGCVLCKVLDFIDSNHCTNSKELLVKELEVHPANWRWVGLFYSGDHDYFPKDKQFPDGSVFRLADGPKAGLYIYDNGVPQICHLITKK